ncbi:4'-phosphopantetheinyl transferase family protein [Paenibacillus sp. sgz500958]|uniref:4'-phosphopantetheinyl transferase family protein n=1 Tax=Paenibacillus sp. sgz500958 TaxID=3242475 RepID=UPI0036D2DFC1
MTDIYYININEELSQEDYDKLLGICTADKRETIGNFRFEADRKRTLYGEALARYMIAKNSGIPMNDIQLVKNPFGKPYLNNREGIHFNVSHSGNYVVCGLDDQNIGVDIEEVRDIGLDLAKSYFHIKEYAYIISQEMDRQIQTLYDFWTLKESYIKYLGVGLNKPLGSFYFTLDGSSATLYSQENPSAYFYRYLIGDHYKLAVCVEKAASIHLELISLHEIVSHLDIEHRLTNKHELGVMR